MEGVNILYMQSHWEVTTSMLTYIPAKLIKKKKKAFKIENRQIAE